VDEDGSDVTSDFISKGINLDDDIVIKVSELKYEGSTVYL